MKRRKRRAPVNFLPLGIVGTLLFAQSSLEAAPPNPPDSAPHQPWSIRWQTDPSAANKFYVEVSGFDAFELDNLRQADWNLAQWQRLLSVYTEQDDLALKHGIPAMLGVYRVAENSLRFEPQFPLATGIKYRAVFNPNQSPGSREPGGKLFTSVYSLPPPASTLATVVSHVYPSAEVLPENLLKFYLHFSAPMSRGHIYDYIHLRDDKGKDVELPFLEIGEELWNPAMTRLTLFIDPGRIKRGVRPLEEIGPSLQEGKRYTLVIDRDWKDGAGNPLKKSFQKPFKVGPPDRQPLNPAQWRIGTAKSGTRQPVTIAFPKPMDHALAQRIIRITDESGRLVQGETALQQEERHWTFVPDAPWHRGPYGLLVETTLEDLAGNNIGKPFEVDLFDDTPGHLTNLTVRLPFEVR